MLRLDRNSIMDNQTISRYDSITQALHWLTAIVILVAFIYGPGGPETRIYAPARDFERQLHETLGLCVFILVLIRLVWRLFDQRPGPPDVAPWMNLAARIVQGGFYVLMIALPITAVAGAWLAGHPVTLLAGIEVQPMLATSHDTGEFIADLHGWLGVAIMWLAGAHALAAIYHHLWLKDRVLVSMLPLPLAALIGRRLKD